MIVIISIILVALFILAICIIKTPFIDGESNCNELYDKFGYTYVNKLVEEKRAKDKTIKRLEKRLKDIQSQVDTCVLIFEEYFVKDQTDDDLLVLAFEQLHKISRISIDGFCIDEDTKRILRKGLYVIKLELQKQAEKWSA